MGFDHVDLIYAERPPEGISTKEVVEQVSGLLASGKARTWGVLNWRPELIAEATAVAQSAGVMPPCAAQLVYSLANPEIVEDDAMADKLDAAGTSVVASSALAGGALCGKYARGEAGRLSGQLDSPRWRDALEIGSRLNVVADELGATPAQVAVTFALDGPRVSSVLFGATTPEQVAENVAALDIRARLTDVDLTSLRALAARDA